MSCLQAHDYVLVRVEPRHNRLTFAPLVRGRLAWSRCVCIRSPKAQHLDSSDLGETYADLF